LKRQWIGIDISPMPVRHGQTPARRLHLPESEPLWRAERGFAVREQIIVTYATGHYCIFKCV